MADDDDFDLDAGDEDEFLAGGETAEIDDHEAWQRWWDARVAAIEEILGPSDDVVGHAMIPFMMGPEVGGAADIIYFRKHLPGCIAVTSELIGCEEQVPNEMGNYELMVCHRDDEEWGAELISQLSHYTLEAELNPGDTMDIAPAVPKGATIVGLLFCDYARFQVLGRKAGLLLCIGLTADEVEMCQDDRADEVLAALKAAKVYPYTDLFRPSVLAK